MSTNNQRSSPTEVASAISSPPPTTGDDQVQEPIRSTTTAHHSPPNQAPKPPSLTINKNTPTSLLSAFQSAKLTYLIPLNQDEATDQTTNCDELADDRWVAHVIQAPRRPVAYCGERLRFYLVMSLNEPAKSKSTKTIRASLRAGLSMRLEAKLVHSSLLPLSVSADNSAGGGPDNLSPIQQHHSSKSTKPRPLANAQLLSPTPSSPARYAKHPQGQDTIQLFTANYPHSEHVCQTPVMESAVPSPAASDNANHVKPPDGTGEDRSVKMRIGKLGNQWQVVWEIHGEIGYMTNDSKQILSLLLSSVIIYDPAHLKSTHPELPISQAMVFSDSPKQIAFQKTRDYAAEHESEINIFEGMGRDVTVSLTRPLSTTSGTFNSSQTAAPHKHSGKPGPAPNRFTYSYSNLKGPLESMFSNHSDESLVSPADRRQSVLHPPSLIRSSTSTGSPLQRGQSLYEARESEPVAAERPSTERMCELVVPIHNPISVRGQTVVARHQLMSANLPGQSRRKDDTVFVEMEQPAGLVLLLELCYPGDGVDPSGGRECEGDFLVEDVEIKMDELGVSRELDRLDGTSIHINPLFPPADPTGSSLQSSGFPSCRLSAGDQHNLIYTVKIDLADLLVHHPGSLLSEDVRERRRLSNLQLPPPTPISSIASAFQHQKTGIPVVEESNNDDVAGPTVFGGTGEMHDSNGWMGNSHQAVRSRAQPFNDHIRHPELPEPELGAQHLQQQTANYVPVYLLSVTLQGRIVGQKKQDGGSESSTSVISSVWTATVSSRELSRSMTLDLRRQTWKDDRRPKNWVGERPLQRNPRGQLVALDKSQLRALPRGPVAGSKRHTASGLASALSGLSYFQHRLAGAQERAQPKLLAPLETSGLYPKLKVESDPPSPSLLAAGLRLFGTHTPAPAPPEEAARPTPPTVPALQLGPGPTPKLSVFAPPPPVATTGWTRDHLMVDVKIGGNSNGRDRNVFKVWEEFLVEVVVVNRSGKDHLDGFSIKSWNQSGRGGLLGLDGVVETGVICAGGSSSGRMRFVGIEKGIHELEGIELYINNKLNNSNDHNGDGRSKMVGREGERLGGVVLVSPVVVVIE